MATQPARIIVVSGVPAAGKSTVARELAGRFERAAHIEGDVLQQMIVSGRQWPGVPLEGEGLRQLQLRAKNACLLARSFADAGITAIIYDIVVGSRVAEFREHLRGCDAYFVMLAPELDAVRERDAGRSKHAFHESLYLDPILRGETERVGLWLDTSSMPVEAVVSAIVERLAEARFSG